jgi:hypothetical protein
MIKNINIKLSQAQKDKGIIFISTLSECKTIQAEDVTHVIYNTDDNARDRSINLLDTAFFNNSHFNYNIIAQ